MKAFLGLLLLCITSALYGQWTGDGNGNNSATGNVTIGGGFQSSATYGFVLAPSTGDAVIRRSTSGSLMLSSGGGTSEIRLNYNYGGGSGGLSIFDGGTVNHALFKVNSTGNLAIVPNGGNIGVNAYSPTTRLYIMEPWAGNTPDAPVANQGILVTGAATGGAINLGIDGNGTNGVPFFSWIQSRHRDQATYYSLSLNPMGGNIGIGTKNPLKKLHISGASDVEQWIEATDDGYASLTLKSNGKQWHWSKRPGSAQDALHLYYNDGIWSDPYLAVLPGGNVGIGTTSPGSFKLAVNGKIWSQEVNVAMTNPGPDYVFEKDYDLLSLSELESYINQHKHLPEVPSAKQMEEEGLNLKEMNLILLKKVEELTLHLIEMKKENSEIKAENEKQNRIINSLLKK